MIVSLLKVKVSIEIKKNVASILVNNKVKYRKKYEKSSYSFIFSGNGFL